MELEKQMFTNRKKIAEEYNLTKSQTVLISKIYSNEATYGKYIYYESSSNKEDIERLVELHIAKEVKGGYILDELGKKLVSYVAGGELVY